MTRILQLRRGSACFRNSIRQKIVGIAAGLIVLAVITSLLSMVMAGQVGHLLDELTNRYIPAYGHLARVNIRALERSLALRPTSGGVTAEADEVVHQGVITSFADRVRITWPLSCWVPAPDPHTVPAAWAPFTNSARIGPVPHPTPSIGSSRLPWQ